MSNCTKNHLSIKNFFSAREGKTLHDVSISIAPRALIARNTVIIQYSVLTIPPIRKGTARRKVSDPSYKIHAIKHRVEAG